MNIYGHYMCSIRGYSCEKGPFVAIHVKKAVVAIRVKKAVVAICVNKANRPLS